MELKRYQQATLDALDRFLTRVPASGPAEAFVHEVAHQERAARLSGEPLPARKPYQPLTGLPQVPYVCLRLPTGGGKTLLAAESVRLWSQVAARPQPLVLWSVSSTAIKDQTLDALSDRTHAYRRRLDAAFGGRVRVFDIEAFDMLTPADLAQNACVIVSTIQAFRVGNTSGRRVYAHHEALEPFFSALPTEGMERVSQDEAAESPLLTEGTVKFSLANLLYHHRPLMLVDEAHNAVTGLSRDVQARVRPAAVIEFTATPKDRNNILFSVTATALKDEEMIKLPIRLRPHGDWRSAVDGALRTRRMLEENAKRDKGHIRPVVLYQAQPKGREPTVEQIRDYLVGRLVPPGWIKIATGDRRELDGVNLRDPSEPTRHVITVQALREGWDCPSAYVLCATQKLRSATAVEQLLGRVLRMPYAERRKDPALNMAYAHVSEPEFNETAQALTDKLIGMGFTDEEVKGSVQPDGLAAEQGMLFDPTPVRPQPVWQVPLADSDEVRAVLTEMAEAGVEWTPATDGSLTAGIKGEVVEAVAERLITMSPETNRPTLRAALEKHREKVEQRRSPAEKGAVIEVPLLFALVDGELIPADTDSLMELSDWSLSEASACLDEADLKFRRSDEVMEIDLDGEKLVYSRTTVTQPALQGLGKVDDDSLAGTLVQWLERACRAPDLPQDHLRAWISAAVAHLRSRRGIPVQTLADWQDALSAKLRQRIAGQRDAARHAIRQAALFDEGAAPTISPHGTIRFDASTYADVALTPLNRLRFQKHLLGNDAVPAFDGDETGEEFACAQALDALEQVEVWLRNIPRHRDSFSLPLLKDNFYPDFVAKLTDGRLFIVEYKGADRATNEDTRNKTQIGTCWARASGHVYATIEKAKHGLGMAEQMRTALKLDSRETILSGEG
ncbi:restriction endonuclease subunit R [Paracoccus sp. S-4012]|uniref:DEAD/DEAH box helicase n=1 Tax=Paracoccus sp. S-4012 TaxID=2665648 RepID=UPI0012B139F3|nr:DEAD/DEAH box helicase family protein [Paracoccus sp. S-4012]MRX48853.1 restriction endonuclease subunit R [Paracoccus sp. S-4012]